MTSLSSGEHTHFGRDHMNAGSFSYCWLSCWDLLVGVECCSISSYRLHLMRSVASGLISLCTAKLIRNPTLGQSIVTPFYCKSYQQASYGTALATTTVATFMIWYKTWCASLAPHIFLSLSDEEDTFPQVIQT